MGKQVHSSDSGGSSHGDNETDSIASSRHTSASEDIEKNVKVVRNEFEGAHWNPFFRFHFASFWKDWKTFDTTGKTLLVLSLVCFIIPFPLFHYYIQKRLVAQPMWLKAGKTIPTAVVGACHFVVFCAFLFFIVGYSSSEGSPPESSNYYQFAYGLSGLLLEWMTIFALLDITQFVMFMVAKARHEQWPHRKAQDWYTLKAVLAFLIGFSLSSSGWAIATQDPTVRHYNVKLPKFPAALNGFKLAVISDVHVGPTITPERAATARDLTNEQNPDMVLLVGDMTEGKTKNWPDGVQMWASLNAKYGAYFVTGNHEYINDNADEWIQLLSDIGIKTLRNENIRVPEAKYNPPATFVLAGVDDYSVKADGQREYPGHVADINKAMQGVDTSADTVVLAAHQPNQIIDADKLGVNLQVSGHTHAGQLWPMSFFTYVGNEYYAGLYRHDSDTQVFVNEGTYYWGVPMKIGAINEIAILNLSAE
eukprot:GFYU01004820.1.p1 GENE.GFYU01004820.1~~GFYU01004820.1.p1  ORF type:complete len:478 (-),score=108.66 GFYU01004820.1:107-1540(-)